MEIIKYDTKTNEVLERIAFIDGDKVRYELDKVTEKEIFLAGFNRGLKENPTQEAHLNTP